MRTHANYATVYVGAQLSPDGVRLDLDWADAVGDVTDEYEFEVPTDEPSDPFLGIQAFDVGEYGHEIVLNGESLSGFDIPPNDGWQYWADSVTGVSLVEGTNTLALERDGDTDDAFAVGTVRVHWKEPATEGFRAADVE
ncbi:hypothetical protein HUG10_16835 [Halorarum halophilum]|uniref:Uncharacterized protein n=1 Tax=Halorarum halophilum TaxID=2743090 RepID=A0A7D5GDM7_9EURY|nr:hypothetical protein [Halobaculum halophilum]QLG29092.1 hypothetical protein HUG10_16835 [Halobaculum halophilum]